MNKYRNIKTPYNGRMYDSIIEAAEAINLDLRKQLGDVTDWWPQFRIPLKVNGNLICTHVVDFRVMLPDGSIELIEVKGYETREWKLKRKLLEATYLAEHPDVRYRVVK